jgi:hypothetical protein
MGAKVASRRFWIYIFLAFIWYQEQNYRQHLRVTPKMCIYLPDYKENLEWIMSPIGLIVSCKSPHSGMHWLRFHHMGMHWLGSPIRACIDSGVNKCILCSLLQMILRHCVIKWRHNVKILTDLESIHYKLSYEVLHDMVLSISKFDHGVHHFWPWC